MNAVNYIHSLRTFGKKAGLKNIESLLHLMDNPQNDLEFVHVAGTNGKGSVSSMLNSIFIAQGKKVGLFTSPFIECFNERICVNNTPIPDDDLERITYTVKPLVDRLAEDEIYCTVFDVVCAVGFQYFKEEQCDIVVLEVGLGGRFDATNIITSPKCTVICAIGYDHTQYLGNTIAEIAFEKCGTIKNNCPTVCYPLQDDDALKVIEKTCKEKSSELTVADISDLTIHSSGLYGSEFSYKGRKYNLSLVGQYQCYNALCAIETAFILGVDYDSIYNGIKEAVWKCRFEVFSVKDKIVVLDGAHNSHGIKAFLHSADKFFADKKVHYVFGILNEKDVEKSCELMSGTKGNITVTTVPSERSTDPKVVYKSILKYRDNADYIADNIDALEYTISSDCDVVCVLGSLYMVGAMRKTVEKFSHNDKTI